MTLSNRREPSFHGSQGSPHSPAPDGLHVAAGDAAAHKAARASGLTRVVSTAQIVGSLLAVPLGLASGYSMYKANFAVDTTCQNLRASIVAMLDKNVDASTRRMLVRRDITTFEQTCGSFDPDAQAAFKTLLAAPSPAATAAAPKLRSALPAADVARKNEPKNELKVEAKTEPKAEAKAEPKTEARADTKTEPRAAVAEKAPVPAAASLESIEREAALSDARWLAAVRQALVTNTPEAPRVTGSPPAMLEAPAAKPARAETLAVEKPPVQLQPTWTVPAAAPAAAPVNAAPPVVAPQIAAPVPAADVPGRITPVKDSAPRPPAPITGPAPINGATDSDDSATSRIGSWIAQIPLVGRVIEPRGN